MMLSFVSLALASLLGTALAGPESDVVGTSWGPNRIDLFGVNSVGDIWHKYYDGHGWQPTSGPGTLELFTQAHSAGSVSATSWGKNRLDFVFIDTDEKVRHKYWTGSEWSPSGTEYESLGKGPVSGLAINSWGKNRLDIVGLGENGECLHKAWTGDGWYPEGDDWEDLGGPFSSAPALVSWSKDRLDIFGINEAGGVSHKYWNHGQWVPDSKVWEDLGGDNFTGVPVASSMEEGRLDVWAIGNETSELYHLFYDSAGGVWRGWENLGGEFVNAPQVAHWSPNRIDLLGYGAGDAAIYLYKYWDGSQWSDWDVKGQDFATEPALISLGERNLNLAGLDYDGGVKLQVWAWDQWLPSYYEWYTLGNTTTKEETGKDSLNIQNPGLRSSTPQMADKEVHIEIELKV